MAGSDPIWVLHVDDNPAFLETMAALLARESDRIEVETTTDPTDALPPHEEPAYDCIVSDYDMPEMTGVDLVERVRESDPELPVVILTGEGSEAVASDAIAAGVTDYLTKGSGTDRSAVLANRITTAVENYRTRTALAQSERRYDRLVGGAPTPIVVYAPDGEVLDANAAAAEFLGVGSVAALAGRRVPEFVPPEGRAEFRERVERMLATGEPVGTFPLEIATPDGERRHAVVASAPVRYEDGPAVQTIAYDVTERKRRERRLERLLDASRRFARADDRVTICEAVVDTVTDVLDLPLSTVWLHDEAENRLEPVAVSEGVDETFDGVPSYEPGNSLSWAAFESGESRFYDRVGDQPGAYDPETAAESELILPLGDHGVANIGSTEAEDLDALNRSLAELLGANATAALDRTLRETRFRTLFEQSVDAVFLHGAEGEIIEANPRAADSLGYDRATLAEMNVADVEVERSAGELAALWDGIGPNEVVTARGVHQRADGSTFPVELRVGRVDSGGDREYIAAARDVTERERRERRLERQNARLEEFASVASHDLRSPLSTAAGRVDLAREEVDSDHLDAAARALDRMEAIIEDLLALARDSDRAIEAEPTDLGTLTEAAWSGVAADAVLGVAETRTLSADPSKLRQLLANLLRNAVEHGGTQVRVGTLPDGFYVDDDGPGIPPERREAVFESGHSARPDGEGFGLAVVRRVAEAHGWTVTVRESEAGGTRVAVTGVEWVD